MKQRALQLIELGRGNESDLLPYSVSRQKVWVMGEQRPTMQSRQSYLTFSAMGVWTR
ncbi:hypothetical protein K443DRAFT_566109 [Laccaria amethystina LaAM-08-1]|uniref:Uncharacterized protein n=1 Tax=Laccaria amethystina LaAM-08-1 TaxID=1095629 RepID=A0A0C9XV98_9AGAR|nr:hypothetical protein K443DRAFT_566109 [Laccaria amethystina LaAM-08-1]